jgi:hypothetical protein
MSFNCSNVTNFLIEKLEIACSEKLSEYERFLFTFLCDEECFKKISSMTYSAVKSGFSAFFQPDKLLDFNSNELETFFQQYS